MGGLAQSCRQLDPATQLCVKTWLSGLDHGCRGVLRTLRNCAISLFVRKALLSNTPRSLITAFVQDSIQSHGI